MCDLSPAVTPVHFPGRQECLPHTVPIRWILVAQLIMWQSSLSGDAAQLHCSLYPFLFLVAPR